MADQQIKPFIDLEDFEKIKTFAQYFVDQKALPKGVDNAGKLVMLLQAGRDLGLSTTQTMSGLALINGVVTVFGTVGATMIRRAGYDWEVIENTSKICKIKMSKEGRKDTEIQYTIEEATHAGITTSATWQKYPQEMLFWKALARARKRYCPEVMDGVALYEDYQELEKTARNGEVIDAEAQTLSPIEQSIIDCQTVAELEALKPEIAKANDKQLIGKYAKKLQDLKNIILPSETITDDADGNNTTDTTTTEEQSGDATTTDGIEEGKDDQVANIGEQVA